MPPVRPAESEDRPGESTQPLPAVGPAPTTILPSRTARAKRSSGSTRAARQKELQEERQQERRAKRDAKRETKQPTERPTERRADRRTQRRAAPVRSAPPSTQAPTAPTASGDELPPAHARYVAAGCALAAAVLLSVTALAGQLMGLAGGLMVALALGWGWPTLLRLPSPRGTTAAVTAGGAMSMIAVGLTNDEPLLRWLPLGLAGGVIAAFVHQLLRRDHRPRLAESVTATVAAQAVLGSAAALLALPRSPVGASGVAVGAVPAAVAIAVQALGASRRTTTVVGCLAAIVLGALLALASPNVSLYGGMLVAALTAALALALHRLLSSQPAAASTAGAAALGIAPLAATGAVAFVVLRLLAS